MFSERLKKRRKELGLTQEELADKISTTKQTIYKYENEVVTNIPSDRIKELAKVLCTTPAYLMGWNEPSDSKKTMANNISRLMKENNMNSKDVYTKIGVPQATFSNWVNAETYPRIDKIEKMAKLFGVSKAELVEENYISLKGLSAEQIKEVKTYIEYLKNKGE